MQHDEPTREQSHDRYFIAGCDSFYQELEADFYKREEYRGADQICVFSINRNLYGGGRRSISQLDRMDRNRLLLNVI